MKTRRFKREDHPDITIGDTVILRTKPKFLSVPSLDDLRIIINDFGHPEEWRRIGDKWEKQNICLSEAYTIYKCDTYFLYGELHEDNS